MVETINGELLVEQFSRGDESAFNRIVEQYSADIATFANQLLGWPGDVDDIMQDIFLAAFINLKKFRLECSLKTWLFTITINKCRSHRYKRMLHQRLSAKAATEYTTHDTLGDKETSEQVRRIVASLPAKYREPVVLKYLQELPAEQICGILGISRNALHVRLSRARERLKQKLTELTES
jgi:RNA polymerase sigma-70 factor (ECF subfamily)